MNTSDLSATLHDVDLVSVNLGPVSEREEADGTCSGYTQLLEVSVD